MSSRHFPIKTATACTLKWAWSSLYLNSGVTASCHRTGVSTMDMENFDDFHNTPLKLQERQDMLEGRWPTQSCAYCRDIEQAGGISDRMRHLTVPDLTPDILYQDPTAVKIDPTIVEVFFRNTCNLSCLYCTPGLSSMINAENQKHGDFKQGGVELLSQQPQFKNFAPLFWQWFETKFVNLKRLHVLGGEPLMQKEWSQLLEMIEKHPNGDCTLLVVTNLMIPTDVLQDHIDRLKNLLRLRALKQVHFICSIDCWGPEQEYVRFGLDLNHWQNNFLLLKSNRWITLGINQTISVLTIKPMPALLEKLDNWRQDRKIGHWFGSVSPGPDYLKPHILGDIFADDFDQILKLMPERDDEDRTARDYMLGIAKQSSSTGAVQQQIEDLFVFLAEKDRRRGTDWQQIFPWLKELKDRYVV